MNFRLDVHLYHHTEHERDDHRLLLDIARGVSILLTKGNRMTQEIDDLKQAVADVKAAVDQFPGAVNAFEARITEILKNSGMSQEDKDAITGATADLKAALATATDSLADAADGTDEADTPTT